jgi:uncharacterized protein DUF1566
VNPGRRAGRLTVLAAAALAWSCGGASRGEAGPGAGDGGSPPVATTHSCTGPIPVHATMCPGADAALAEDSPRLVVGPFGSCGAVACSYACDAAYGFVDAGCSTLPSPPAPHFVDNGDGTVTDTASGRVWLRDAGCADSADGVARSDGATWWQARDLAARLSSGSCGLTDGSAAGTWRLAAEGELATLWSLSGSGANPFTNLRPGAYWSSTAHSASATAVDVGSRLVDQFPKDSLFHVWPCR